MESFSTVLVSVSLLSVSLSSRMGMVASNCAMVATVIASSEESSCFAFGGRLFLLRGLPLLLDLFLLSCPSSTCSSTAMTGGVGSVVLLRLRRGGGLSLGVR